MVVCWKLVRSTVAGHISIFSVDCKGERLVLGERESVAEKEKGKHNDT